VKPRTFQTPALPSSSNSEEPGELVTDRWLTTRDAAERLHVSLRTIQLWVEGGILPAARTPGGHRRIPESAVDALAAQTGLGGVLNSHQSNSRTGLASQSSACDILLVEDNADQCLLWERTLEAFGKRITLRTANSGYTGLLQIGRRKPDLLITDLMMPGIDGFEMIRTLHNSRDFGGIKILVISALSAADISDRGGLPEGVEALRKPVSPSNLIERVEHALPQLTSATTDGR
jgi:excisionase family DNA binding protein